MLNRTNGHNSGIVEEFMKKVKDDPDYLNKLNLSPEQRHKFNEFKDKDLKNETNRKKLWDLWLNTVGGGGNK